jgi:hypothetical protein
LLSAAIPLGIWVGGDTLVGGRIVLALAIEALFSALSHDDLDIAGRLARGGSREARGLETSQRQDVVPAVKSRYPCDVLAPVVV